MILVVVKGNSNIMHSAALINFFLIARLPCFHALIGIAVFQYYCIMPVCVLSRSMVSVNSKMDAYQ